MPSRGQCRARIREAERLREAEAERLREIERETERLRAERLRAERIQVETVTSVQSVASAETAPSLDRAAEPSGVDRILPRSAHRTGREGDPPSDNEDEDDR